MIIEASEIRPNKTYEGRVNMTEWLTIGQVIDRLKVGEVAESSQGDTLFWDDDTEDLVIVSSIGREYLTLEQSMTTIKWRIKPNYVSFEEALQAYKNGDTITCYHGKDFDGKTFVESFSIRGSNDELDMDMIVNGKWVIEP